MAVRDLNAIQDAHACKLWWMYHMTGTLWGQYIRARNGGRDDYQPRLYDSPGWHRICAIHSTCISISDVMGDALVWPTSTRDFTIRHTYDVLHIMKSTLVSHKYI